MFDWIRNKAIAIVAGHSPNAGAGTKLANAGQPTALDTYQQNPDQWQADYVDQYQEDQAANIVTTKNIGASIYDKAKKVTDGIWKLLPTNALISLAIIAAVGLYVAKRLKLV